MSLKTKLEELIDELLDEANATGEGEAYNTKYSFGKLDDEDIEVMGYKKVKNVKESTFKKAAKMMMGESSYKSYKKDDSFTPKQKVNRAIKSINSKLYEIEKVLTHNIKLKKETGVDSTGYWKSTRKTLYNISEKMQRISEKLRKF
tara:strand:+ start:26 stop:463 length:438 start_codon:yes stop_codon:yes gene_type:complete